MIPKNVQSVAAFFNEHWQSYKAFVQENRLNHQELFAALNQFLHQQINHPFSFVDVGCGDASLIKSVLLDHPINKYIGIDVAEEVLKTAPLHLASLNCDKKLIYDHMTSALDYLYTPVEIIFCCQSLHHLPSYEEKLEFIRKCKNKLTSDGFLIIIEGVLAANQTRDQVLLEVEEAYKTLYPKLTQNKLKELMNHHRHNVFPEHEETYSKIAHQLGWANVRILLRMGLIVFMVFFQNNNIE
jgi:2-polyprenyl-3-methyl-5-hydroxy-6-metoxy-1,4-benzoquinol methylase